MSEPRRENLSPRSSRILRQKGTEPPFSGEYYRCNREGTYLCKGCGEPLFSSEAKYDSGSGWPSFFKPIHSLAVKEKSDESMGMKRVEITCAECGGHLGHVFPDGPQPTGLRYCVNSASLTLRPKTPPGSLNS